MTSIDGWQVLQGIRKAGKEMPVLFLTAKDSIEDRVKGLETGADDYLVRPFAFAELLARVRTLLRRGRSNKESEVLRAADLELDLIRRRVTSRCIAYVQKAASSKLRNRLRCAFLVKKPGCSPVQQA